MKKIHTLFLALIIAGSLMAQTPQSFKYQAVARDAGGDVVADQSVGMQISILQGSISGTAVYVETFMPTTNEFGLINLNIGAGAVVSGDITTIDWSADTYFMKIEMDITGGTTYIEFGTSQLLSVPYALHAKTAESVTGTVTETDPLFTAWDKTTGINITESQISDLDHFTTSDETDPVFGAHAANGITSTNITNWTTAYGWGDHSTVGYTTTDTTLNEAEVDAFVDNNGYLTNETDPVFGAHIVNGITLTDTANWNAAYGWGDHSILGYFATGGESGGTNRTLGNIDDYSLGFKTNDATRLFITNDGNVGIGMTSPLTKLHIMETGVPNFARLIIQSTDDGAGLRLKSDVGYHCYLDFSDGDSDYVGRIYYSHTDDQMRFRTAGSDAMTINSAGSVGIGTTNPSGVLDVVYESGTFNVNFTAINDLILGSTLSLRKARGTIASPADVQNGDRMGTIQGNGKSGFSYFSTASLQFEVDGTVTSGQRPPSRITFLTNPDNTSAVERMRIDKDGNVGIGTTSPNSKFAVVGLPVYSNNAAAITGGLVAGDFYRTGGDPDLVCVVH